MKCCAVLRATGRKLQTPQLWMEGRVEEGCWLFCSRKIPHLSTVSQQFCQTCSQVNFFVTGKGAEMSRKNFSLPSDCWPRQKGLFSRTMPHSIIITSAEREGQDSRRSGMYHSYNFLPRLGMQSLYVFGFIRLFDEVSRIRPRYLEITSISLIYSLTFSRKKELLFWFLRSLNRLTCVTRLVRGD